MIKGHPATQAEVDALDAYLVTVCDHGLNASTFAARVVASTLRRPHLGGRRRHQRAQGPAARRRARAGDRHAGRDREPGKRPAWIEAALDRGDRLMGFGHRIYRVRDPRADALKRAVKELGEGSNSLPGRLAFAEAVETAALAILRSASPIARCRPMSSSTRR